MKTNAYPLARCLHRLDMNIGRRLYQELQKTPGTEEVTGTNGRIIRYLAEHEDDPIYQRDLEREFGFTRSTASRVLQLMEQKNLINRKGVAHDARLKRVTLTDYSRCFTDQMRENARILQEQLLTGFSEEEIELLHSFISRMQENIG